MGLRVGERLGGRDGGRVYTNTHKHNNKPRMGTYTQMDLQYCTSRVGLFVVGCGVVGDRGTVVGAGVVGTKM